MIKLVKESLNEYLHSYPQLKASGDWTGILKNPNGWERENIHTAPAVYNVTFVSNPSEPATGTHKPGAGHKYTAGEAVDDVFAGDQNGVNVSQFEDGIIMDLVPGTTPDEVEQILRNKFQELQELELLVTPDWDNFEGGNPKHYPEYTTSFLNAVTRGKPFPRQLNFEVE